MYVCMCVQLYITCCVLVPIFYFVARLLDKYVNEQITAQIIVVVVVVVIIIIIIIIIIIRLAII
jgi:hypothetical protein